MGRLAGRIERLDATYGHNRSVFRDAAGRRMYLSTATVLRAFFNWLGGEAMNLDPRISSFLSRSKPTARSSDLELALIDACKEQYAVAPEHQEMRDGPSDLPEDS
jgi:hypothetical protein